MPKQVRDVLYRRGKTMLVSSFCRMERNNKGTVPAFLYINLVHPNYSPPLLSHPSKYKKATSKKKTFEHYCKMVMSKNVGNFTSLKIAN